jgi:hypothetical protein
MITLLAAFALASEVPDGRQLREGESCYSILANKGDTPQTIGSVFQSVTRRQVGKTEALAIVIHQRLANGKFDMRDEFLVRRDDLRPISLDNMRDGKPHVHLDYSETGVIGWKVANGNKENVAVKLSQPVWDGNLWGLTFAALPMKSGARYELPTYQYDKGVGTFTVSVKGQEKVQVGDRSVMAWLVDAGASTDRRTEYLISASGEELGYRAGPMSQLLGGDCGHAARKRGG